MTKQGEVECIATGIQETSFPPRCEAVLKLSGPELNCRLEITTWARLQEIRSSELSRYDRMLLEYELDARQRHAHKPLADSSSDTPHKTAAMIHVEHLTDRGPEDNGYYWYDSESDCDVFGPFTIEDDAYVAGRLGITDQVALDGWKAEQLNSAPRP